MIALPFDTSQPFDTGQPFDASQPLDTGEHCNTPAAGSVPASPRTERSKSVAAILPDIAKVEAAIIEITNTVRADAKLNPVVVSPQLTTAARTYAELLARTGQFSHEADGKLSDRTQRAGYQHCTIAENLAMHKDSRGFETRALAVSAMEGWLNSPGHRKNLMTTEVTQIGVAVAKAPDGDPKYIAVQLFGRPQSASIAFQVSNASPQTVAFTFAGKSRDLTPHMAFTMQSCSGGPIAFEHKGAPGFAARFEAANGTNYTITGGTQGAPLRVDLSKRQTVK